MKNQKISLALSIFFFAAAIVLLVACFVTKHTEAQTEIYNLDTVVVEIDKAQDTVVVQDASGNLWAFYVIDGWQEGDECILIMDTDKTESIYDDIVVKVIRCNSTR